MSKFQRLSIDEKIAHVENRFINVKGSKEIMNLLAQFNIGTDYLDEGIQTIIDARDASIAQKKAYGEQLSATKKRNIKLKEVKAMFEKTEGIATVVLASSDIDTSLKIGLALPDKILACMERIRNFYAGVIEFKELVKLMSRFNRGEDVLLVENEKVMELVDMQAKQIKEKGEAQRSTQLRNQAMNKMILKDREFVSLLKLALGKRNDLLEVAGIFVRS